MQNIKKKTVNVPSSSRTRPVKNVLYKYAVIAIVVPKLKLLKLQLQVPIYLW